MTSTRRNFLIQTSATAVIAGLSPASGQRAMATNGERRKLRIGQIGVAHCHAEGKMKVLRESPDWEVVGVVEADPELRRAAEKSPIYQGVPWITEEQLFNTAGLDAVAVETSVEQLLETAERCLAAGVHIHLDKPPGDSAERLRVLLNEAERRQLTVQMGYMYRYNPAIKLLRELLQDGCLGDVFEINAVMSKQIGEDKRRQWATFPGGTMFELGCHLVDLLVGIKGKPDAVVPYHRHSGAHDDKLLDNMLAVCAYPRCVATIRSTAVEVAGGERRHFVVCGTQGTIHIQPLDSPTVQLALSKPHGKFIQGYQTVALPKYVRYVDDVADLAKVIRGEKPTDFDATHDLAVQQTLLQACGAQA